MSRITLADTLVSLPLPIFLVIEDVGWWQGEDGSSKNQPYRNRFDRRHCLADYQALARLARRLSMRVALGMVMGEWDRTNFLKGVTGATWMGAAWDNTMNRGPWFEEAAGYLRDQRHLLEIALHGICHEFWQDGRMQRSEFHDQEGRMRPEAIVRSHLEAFAELLAQNGLPDSPRLFVPPALNHSFGNGEESMQALLHGFGINYVTTRFSRARQYSVPIHPDITWESEVVLLERGLSPVDWDVTAAEPILYLSNPILALHWGNLLHSDPRRNGEIVDAWADLIIGGTWGTDHILAADLAACWRQAAVYYLANMWQEAGTVIIDLSSVPDLPCLSGSFFLKTEQRRPVTVHCTGAQILSTENESGNVRIVELLPEKGQTRVVLSFGSRETKNSTELSEVGK